MTQNHLYCEDAKYYGHYGWHYGYQAYINAYNHYIAYQTPASYYGYYNAYYAYLYAAQGRAFLTQNDYPATSGNWFYGSIYASAAVIYENTAWATTQSSTAFYAYLYSTYTHIDLAKAYPAIGACLINVTSVGDPPTRGPTGSNLSVPGSHTAYRGASGSRC